MNDEKINNAMWIMETALQFTEKQFETFCERMQDEFQNDKDYQKVLQILCLLDTMRNKKGD